MQQPRIAAIVAVGLALVIGLVICVPVTSANSSPKALDEYLQAIFGCNQTYRGTDTCKQSKEVNHRALLACKVQAGRNYWKDFNEEFHKDILGK
jgi:hypothetical protein